MLRKRRVRRQNRVRRAGSRRERIERRRLGLFSLAGLVENVERRDEGKVGRLAGRRSSRRRLRRTRRLPRLRAQVRQPFLLPARRGRCSAHLLRRRPVLRGRLTCAPAHEQSQQVLRVSSSVTGRALQHSFTRTFALPGRLCRCEYCTRRRLRPVKEREERGRFSRPRLSCALRARHASHSTLFRLPVLQLRRDWRCGRSWTSG